MLKNVLIGANVAYPTSNRISDLVAGQIGVYSLAPTGVTTLISGTPSAAELKLPIIIAQGASVGRNVKSFTVYPKTSVSYLDSSYVAPKPNVWTVGYDGVTSTYDLVSGAAGTYGFKVQNTTMGNPPFPTLSSTPFFQTAGAATSIAIANAILADVNSQALLPANALFPYENFAFAEVLSSATTATTSTTATVTNGSPIVTMLAGIAAVAGDYIKFGATTATTAAIYKIKSVSGVDVVLETPYVNAQVVLGTTIAGLATGFATAATINAATAGIRVTEYGNRFNGSQVLEPQYNLIMNVSCSVNLSGSPMQNNQTVAKVYTAAAGTPATAAIYNEGTGTYSQIFKKELWAAGYSGFTNRSFIPDNFPIYSVDGVSYGTIGFEYMTNVQDYTAQGFHAGQTLSAILAFPNAGTLYTGLNAVLNTTNGWFSVN
jgi:hypothetical protein